MSVCQEGEVYQILLFHHEMWTAIFAPAWGNIGAAWVTCIDYEGEARKDSRYIKWQANSKILVPNIIQVIKNVHHKKKKHSSEGSLKSTGKCLTPTQLLICSSFSRENGYLLLICSSLSTSQSNIDTPGHSASPIWCCHIFENTHVSYWCSDPEAPSFRNPWQPTRWFLFAFAAGSAFCSTRYFMMSKWP